MKTLILILALASLAKGASIEQLKCGFLGGLDGAKIKAEYLKERQEEARRELAVIAARVQELRRDAPTPYLLKTAAAIELQAVKYAGYDVSFRSDQTVSATREANDINTPEALFKVLESLGFPSGQVRKLNLHPNGTVESDQVLMRSAGLNLTVVFRPRELMLGLGEYVGGHRFPEILVASPIDSPRLQRQVLLHETFHHLQEKNLPWAKYAGELKTIFTRIKELKQTESNLVTEVLGEGFSVLPDLEAPKAKAALLLSELQAYAILPIERSLAKQWHSIFYELLKPNPSESLVRYELEMAQMILFNNGYSVDGAETLNEAYKWLFPSSTNEPRS